MNLAPNIGSDRSWVWNVSADVSDGEPTQETLAIRFANSDSASLSTSSPSSTYYPPPCPSNPPPLCCSSVSLSFSQTPVSSRPLSRTLGTRTRPPPLLLLLLLSLSLPLLLLRRRRRRSPLLRLRRSLLLREFSSFLAAFWLHLGSSELVELTNENTS